MTAGSHAARRVASPALAALAWLTAGGALADELPPATDASIGPEYRGRVTIGIQSLHTGSLITDDGRIPGRTKTDTQAVNLAVDYALNDEWQVHVSLPYMRKRSNGGPGAHDPATLATPHPEADFLDDGFYHSNWQDWTLAVSRHTTFAGFDLEQRLSLHIPSSDYSFFANAATGQNLHTLALGFDLSRRVAATNFHYSLGYSYLFREEIGGVNSNKNHVRVSAGYFFSPRLSARLFANGSYGRGRDSSDFDGDRSSEAWYQHDRTSRHNYAIAGIGASYQVNPAYSVSLNAATMIWGRTVHDLEHGYELQVSRGF